MTLGEFDLLLTGQRRLSGKKSGPRMQSLSMGEWIQRAVASESDAGR